MSLKNCWSKVSRSNLHFYLFKFVIFKLDFFTDLALWEILKEYEIEGRYKWRVPPYNMIIHALQTVLHLYKNYLSDVQLPRYEYFLYKWSNVCNV